MVLSHCQIGGMNLCLVSVLYSADLQGTDFKKLKPAAEGSRGGHHQKLRFWAGAIMDEAVEQSIPVIWTQLGVVDDVSTLRAKENGSTVIVDRFPKVREHDIFESI
jgi:hypothetical protein